MHSIAILNRKGGSSKTSVTVHLGGTLARLGRRTLLIDVDPQASLTQGILGPQSLRSDPGSTVAAVWGGDPLPERLVTPTGVDGLWIVPGHESADRWNLPIVERADIGGLRDFLREVRGDFDFVLMDCPPNLYRCSSSALVAATHVVTPAQPEDYGSQGIVVVNRAVRQIQDWFGTPEILGYLLVQVDRRLGIHQAYSEAIRETFPGLVFDTTMPVSATFKEAVAARLPVSHFKPKSAAAKMFVELAEEIERRLSGGEIHALAS
jgi:chromosome partitioning protein